MADLVDGFVLDGSVTMAWCFGDEATPYTDGVRDRLADVRAVVPSIWLLEVANVILVGQRRNRLDKAKAIHFFILLKGLPLLVDEQTSDRAFAEIVELALLYNLSAYDSAYLELAIRRNLPLACLDGKLRAAAIAAGVVLFEI